MTLKQSEKVEVCLRVSSTLKSRLRARSSPPSSPVCEQLSTSEWLPAPLAWGRYPPTSEVVEVLPHQGVWRLHVGGVLHQLIQVGWEVYRLVFCLSLECSDEVNSTRWLQGTQCTWR